MSIFTIPAEKLPTGLCSVSIREPLFKDRREAARRFPGDDAGYRLEELLLASCITAINDEPLPPVPRDPIQTYTAFDHLDAQYLLSTFLAMFTLDRELSEQAKTLATEMQAKVEPVYSVAKKDMPLQQFGFTFRRPTLADRVAMDRLYQGAESSGYSLEEMLFASCIETIDGQPVQKVPAKEIISVVDEWSHLDAQFAVAIFLNIVTLNKQQSDDARDLGKSLRATFTVGSTATETPSKSKSRNTGTQTLVSSEP